MKTKTLLIVLVGMFTINAAQAEMIYICNKDRSYSFAQLRNVFFGRDESVRPIDNTTLHDHLLSFLNITAPKYRDVWRRNFFRKGMAVPPMKKNDQEVINAVSSTPDAIGYVSNVPKDSGVVVCGK